MYTLHILSSIVIAKIYFALKIKHPIVMPRIKYEEGVLSSINN